MRLKKVKGLSSHTANVERFQAEPAWNDWPHEKSLYHSLIEAGS